MEYSITEVAEEIHKELEEPANPSVNQIFYWLSYNAGKLNNKISTFYELVDENYSPQLGTDEKDILKALYYQYYYTDLSRKSLTNSQGAILSLRDDVSAVSFTNSKEIARVYRETAKDYENQAYALANLYKHNRSGPRDPRNSHDGHWE